MIVGIDAGNYEVKVISKKGADRFPSDLGEYRERKLEQKFSENDMVVEYGGKKYFAGTLAKYESEFNGRIMGGSKAHKDCLLRVLIALHRIGADSYKIIVGQPIECHTKEEKESIKRRLLGSHAITINGIARSFRVDRVEVGAEGANASYMLISGCDKKNFNELQSELYPYREEDLLGLSRYHSLNLIKCNDGYGKFITKLPKPIS